jgi:methionyl-tRNA formyltransferase
MRIAFAGTPAFAAAALEAIAGAGHDIVLVLTQPDRPAGRGMAQTGSAVKQVAQRLGAPLHQPERLRDPATHVPLRDARADVLVVAAYGLILPQAVLDIPRLGAVNVHASLLPRWRGAAPIHRALLAGDATTGITIMQMDAGLDTGPMLLREPLAIAPDDTVGTLHDRLAALGATLIVRALDGLARGALHPEPQPAEGVTYAAKIDKREARLDWSQSAAELERRIRAFHPVPGAVTSLRGHDIKVWRAQRCAGRGAPGEVLAAGTAGVEVACGDAALRITELQRAGGKRLPPAEFLRGCPIAAGDRLDPPPAAD